MRNHPRPVLSPGALVFAALLGFAPTLFAQGCLCAYLVTTGLGAEGTYYLPAGHWSASTPFRYYYARQNVLGDTPLSHPIIYVSTHVYQLDFHVTYALTDRFDVSLDGPFQYGTRESSIEHLFNSTKLHTMSLGLSVSAGLRFEGVPKLDLNGASDGFRLPGNSLSFEPGLTLTRGKQSFSVSAPIAIHRHADNFVANERSGSLGEGFDPIADWQLIISFTREV